MSIPKCEECLRKHLADALSLGKEVINGHSAGGNPDHRIDFSGEMIEAEKHALILDKNFGLKIRAMRRILQTQRWKPLEQDLEKIRCLWYVSYVIEGKKVLEQLEKEDQELANIIKEKLVEYSKFPLIDEQSDIVKHCKCGSEEKKQFKYDIFGSPTIVLIPSDEEISERQKSNINANIIGIDNIVSVPALFEKWPKFFIEGNEEFFSKYENFVMCLWPKEVEIVRKTNVLAFPSIIKDENGNLSEPDTMFCEKTLLKRPKKFYRLPVYISSEILVKLCEEYEKITGKQEISDIYSIIRSFDKSPEFTNENGIVVFGDDKVNEKTLFRLNNCDDQRI